MLGTLCKTDNLPFWEVPLTRMGFRGSRVQIPPSRLKRRATWLAVFRQPARVGERKLTVFANGLSDRFGAPLRCLENLFSTSRLLRRPLSENRPPCREEIFESLPAAHLVLCRHLSPLGRVRAKSSTPQKLRVIAQLALDSQ